MSLVLVKMPNYLIFSVIAEVYFCGHFSVILVSVFVSMVRQFVTIFETSS